MVCWADVATLPDGTRGSPRAACVSGSVLGPLNPGATPVASRTCLNAAIILFN